MKTIGIIILTLAMAILSACAVSQPVPLQAQQQRVPAMIAVGTLSSVGTCEYDVAPAFTAIILSRRLAAARVGRGFMTADEARAVQSFADAARVEIEHACPNPAAKSKPDPERLARVSVLLSHIKSVLEKQR